LPELGVDGVLRERQGARAKSVGLKPDLRSRTRATVRLRPCGRGAGWR
jgi:hypothetical protein